jgi:plastocyanin
MGTSINQKPFIRGKMLVGLAVLAATIGVSLGGAATPVKGKLTNFMKLLNPVWVELKDPEARTYTFREPSPTVKAEFRKLYPYLPKEVCVTLIGTQDQPKMKNVEVKIGGGRTTPVTLVVTPGTQITFKNTDPFPHRLYAVNLPAFSAGDTKAGGDRTWTAPAEGVFEIRDELTPSLRTWVVVNSKVAAFGYPDLSGDFNVDLPVLGEFKVQVYFAGAVVGTSALMNITNLNLPVDLTRAPIKVEQKSPPKEAASSAQEEN